MNIGIFVPNVGNFGVKGYYNSQEVGLAKELSRNNCNVTIFKLVSNTYNIRKDIINDRCKITYIPAQKIGANGIVSNFNFIKNENIDKLVCFSDIQMIVSKLYKYCNKNNIEFIPYIGTVESSNRNIIIKNLMILFKRKNIKIYKKCNKVMAKTPSVYDFLYHHGINKILLSPVGLDFELMNQKFQEEDSIILKKKLGYIDDDKIILFIGRLEEQKNPLLAIEIIRAILLKDKSYKMIIIGNGKLKYKVLEEIDNGLSDKVNFIEKINNSEIWKYYKISNYFINLNEEEIFGMAILESMYYKCPVIAVKAPGPNYIISNKDVGFLVDSLDKEEIVKIIFNEDNKLDQIKYKAHEHIRNYFSWSTCSKNILL